jgi:CDGSH-type Zn-finger protein
VAGGFSRKTDIFKEQLSGVSYQLSAKPPAHSDLAESQKLRAFSGGIMSAVKITVRKNGPYRVEAPEGSVEMFDGDGNKFDLTGKPAFSLCRCGGSVNKPFCDGTHSKIGFLGAESAVKKVEEAGGPKAGS